MIEEALRYPTDHDDWIKTLVIGGVLTFLGFLLIPLFVVYGYLVRAIRASIDGEPEPPEFEDWRTLLVDGFQAWLISVIYLLIPGIVAVITIGGALTAIATGGRLGATGGVAGLFGGLGLTLVLSLVFGYVAVAAIVNFAHEGRFGAAFDFGTLRDTVFDGDFATAWVVSIVAFVVAAVVAGVPVIGYVLGPFVAFYAAVVAARLLAGGFADVVEDADTPPRAENGRPVA